MRSMWVKVLPWYYTDRKDPGRHNVETEAVAEELRHNVVLPSAEGFRHAFSELSLPAGEAN